jgi:hypothetical protein
MWGADAWGSTPWASLQPVAGAAPVPPTFPRVGLLVGRIVAPAAIVARAASLTPLPGRVPAFPALRASLVRP